MGHAPAAEDLPPALAWERPLWELYLACDGQWRMNMNGPIGLDLTVFLPLIARRGWDENVALALLGAIERGVLTKTDDEPDEDEADGREDPDTDRG